MTKKEAGVTNEKRGKGPGMTFLRWDDKLSKRNPPLDSLFTGEEGLKKVSV
jgi:hypothetical protein